MQPVSGAICAADALRRVHMQRSGKKEGSRYSRESCGAVAALIWKLMRAFSEDFIVRRRS